MPLRPLLADRWQADYRRLAALARPAVVAGEDATRGWADDSVAALNRFDAGRPLRRAAAA